MKRFTRPLFVFDIDETLVHTFDSKSGYQQAVQQAEKNPIYELYTLDLDGEFYWGYIRPYAREMLTFCSEVGNFGFWSAGMQDYVEAIVDVLLKPIPNVKPKFVWSRNYCKNALNKWNSTKEFDMKKPLENISHAISKGIIQINEPIGMQDIVIIDDRDDVCSLNLAHYFNIKAFKPDKKPKKADDNEFEHLIQFIEDGLQNRKHILEICSQYNS